MNILFCGDKNIADGVLLSTLSLMRRVREDLHIYILTATVNTPGRSFAALGGDFADFLSGVLMSHNPEDSVTLIDVTNEFSRELPQANLGTRFTPCCMLRLYADLVPALPGRILYLDNDVICRLDPSDFYYQSLEGAELAGVLDFYGSHFFFRHFPIPDYINSGVLLLDLDRIRMTGLFSLCRKRCREKKMFMPDQSAINKLAHKKKLAKRRFNEQRRLHKNTVFQHFTTSFRLFPYFHSVSVKPWNIDGMHETLKLFEYDDLLCEFLAKKEIMRELFGG